MPDFPNFTRGDIVLVRTIDGDWLEKVARGPVTQGGDFPVVYAVRVEVWEDAMTTGKAIDWVPWPAEDVKFPTGAAAKKATDDA